MINKHWKNFSISTKLYFVVGTMALLIVMELLTLKFAMNKLSAVRAFVGGESSWSKAQKTGVHQLHQYITTGNVAFYNSFKESLKVPEGDRLARTELMRPNPDLEVVRASFIQGEIHPDDLDNVIILLRDFHKISYIKEAIRSWTLGDKLLVDLSQEADTFYELQRNNKLTSEKRLEIAANVNRLNYEISLAEANFSSVLGEGSRWLERLVFMILFGFVLTVEFVGLTLTYFTSRSISNGLKDLIDASREISNGNFSKKITVKSDDEIGQLTQAINEMGSILEKSYKELSDSHNVLEKKVAIRTAELNAALLSRDEFLSVASHEIRTPLTALTMQLEMMGRFMKKNNVHNEALESQIEKSISHVRRMSVLQNLLMDVTSMRVGKLELKKDEIDLNEVVTQSISQFDGEIKFSRSEKPLRGEFDSIRMVQVISNLLSNAIKYGDGKPVEVISEVTNHGFVIKVRDHGKGISKEQHDKIFERFERLHHREEIPGLGLGLYIARQIIEAHGGTLDLESEVGNGSVFIVTLS